MPNTYDIRVKTHMPDPPQAQMFAALLPKKTAETTTQRNSFKSQMGITSPQKK